MDFLYVAALLTRPAEGVEDVALRSRPQERLGFVLSVEIYERATVLSARMLEFEDLEITLNPPQSEFQALFTTEVLPHFPRGSSLSGRFLFYESWVLTAAMIRRPDVPVGTSE